MVNKVYVPFMITWLRHHKDGWEYTYRDDPTNRAFVAKNFPSFLKTYDGFKQGVQRADAVRYMLLYKYGGVYADLDTTCLKPFDQLYKEMDSIAGVIIGQEPSAHSVILQGKEQISCNAIMISKPGHRFWRVVMEMMQLRRFSRDPVDSTGPRMLQRAYERWQREAWISELPVDETVRLLPAEYFYPKLALWNRNDIFDGPCLQNTLATKLRRAGKAMQAKAAAICETMTEVGWTEYSDGFLYSNRSYAVHQWFFNWGMVRKTYHPDAVVRIEEVVRLAKNMSFNPNVTEYLDRYGTKGPSNGTKKKLEKLEADLRHTCVSWRQTASCRPNGRRESRKDRACDKIVPKGASGFCACGGGRKVQVVGCYHHHFRCDEECSQDSPVSKAYPKPKSNRTKVASTTSAGSKAAG
jgi:hypothetical protein